MLLICSRSQWKWKSVGVFIVRKVGVVIQRNGNFSPGAAIPTQVIPIPRFVVIGGKFGQILGNPLQMRRKYGVLDAGIDLDDHNVLVIEVGTLNNGAHVQIVGGSGDRSQCCRGEENLGEHDTFDEEK